jgi:hypothetical protein
MINEVLICDARLSAKKNNGCGPMSITRWRSMRPEGIEEGPKKPLGCPSVSNQMRFTLNTIALKFN